MKKRLLVLVLALFAGLFLVACDEKEKPVEEEKELTLFHIFFNDNVTIDFGSEFNVLNGVTAVGDDYKDYSDKVTYTSTATISATHMLDTTVSGVVTINYRVSVGTIVATKTRTITVRDEAYVEPEPEWKGYAVEVEAGDGQVTITYENTPDQWWNNNAQLAVKDFDGTKNSVKFTFTGVANHEYLFKIEGVPNSVNKEQAIIGTGSEQTVTLDLSLMTEAQRNSLSLIIVFVKTKDASGSLVVKTWEYGAFIQPTEPQWQTSGAVTATKEGTTVTITYTNTPTEWWNNHAKLQVVDFDQTKTKVVFTFTGVAGQEYKFKVEGPGVAKEEAVTATGESQVFTFDISSLSEAQRDAINLLVVFNTVVGASGTIVITNIQFAN